MRVEDRAHVAQAVAGDGEVPIAAFPFLERSAWLPQAARPWFSGHVDSPLPLPPPRRPLGLSGLTPLDLAVDGLA